MRMPSQTRQLVPKGTPNESKYYDLANNRL
jgi:hypothetical protein